MAKIVTLTVNPALDLTTDVDSVEPTRKLRCASGTIDTGGGGVNVARALKILGVDAVALYAIGGTMGDAYRGLLEAEGIDGRPFSIGGETRLSFTVGERDGGDQYRFVLPGPELARSEWIACLDQFGKLLEPGDFAVMSGSLPPGVPEDFYARGAQLAKGAEARPVVDTSGPALRAALEEGVYLIKPNARELDDIAGEALNGRDRQEAVIRKLVDDGMAEIVALTLGPDGCIVASREELIEIPTPEVEPKSAVGAGDSFLAGFLNGLNDGRGVEAAARKAVAAGAAALLTPATELCRKEDVDRLEASLA